MGGSNRPRRPRRSSSSSSESGDETRSLLRRHLRDQVGIEKKKEADGSTAWWIALASLIVLAPLPFSDKLSKEYHGDGYITTDSLLRMYAEDRNPDFFNAFKPRPQGLRYRDESALARYSWNNYTAQQIQQPMMVMPLVTERPRNHMGRNPMTPTTSNEQPHSSRDPSIEDIELIDVLWRSDIAAEKGTRQLAPSDQYERDLQLLTEKSVHAPLSAEESSRYEDLAKVYFEDFYNPAALRSDKSGAFGLDVKRDVATPTDEDLEALFEDVSKESGQLNSLVAVPDSMLEPPRTPLLNNVSLSQGIIFNQNNVTELTYLHEQRQAQMAEQTQPQTGLYNGSAIEMHPWIRQADLGPSDLYPTGQNHSFPAFPSNETPVAVVSNGVHYDHAYQAAPTNIPAATNPPPHVYDPYYSARTVSFSNESSSVCSSSSATSPHYMSEAENHTPPTSRYFGKMAPQKEDEYRQNFREKNSQTSRFPLSSSSAQPRRRGRQSKDEQLASSHGLPVTAKEIAEMSLTDLQKMLKNDRLTDYQKSLIKKIRRRGKNKVAARTCRQRRGDRAPSQKEEAHWAAMSVHSNSDDYENDDC